MDHLKLQKIVKDFAVERDWLQFHTPKNLVMALAGEVGELTEIFQWLTTEESQKITEDVQKKEALEDEMADCLLYLLRLADCLEIDLEKSCLRKMEKNAAKYPVKLSKGNAKKYTEF